MALEYDERFYRQLGSAGRRRFTVRHRQSDLLVLVDPPSFRPALADAAREQLVCCHRSLLGWARVDPRFLSALEPYALDPDAPALAAVMAAAAARVGVGPMAAVAGAIAECVGRHLLGEVREVVVENGGDVFIAGPGPVKVAVFAGTSPLSLRLAVEVDPGPQGVGVCTSSGTVGPSLSFGRADAALVVAEDTALADAAATALGNRVRQAADIPAALEWAQGVAGLRGALVIQDSRLGVWGELRLASG